MRRVVKFLYDFFEVYIAAAVFAILILSVVVQVFMRYVLIRPSPELFELAIYAFIWIIYLGAALACRFNQHVRFDIIYQRLPPRVSLGLDVFFHFLTNCVLLFMLYPVTKYTIDMFHIKASALQVPWSFLLGVYPVFVVLVLVHNFTTIVQNVAKMAGRKVKDPEVPPWL